MGNTILIGAQWGDEGKGKVIDYLTDEIDIVVRSQGGNNAGHTVIDGDKRYVLHLVPSGILRPGKVCVIGNGVVIDPPALVKEIEGIREQGIAVEVENFRVSDCAHLVFPYHRALDAQREVLKGDAKIGTTKRGIGPAYGDKAARTGLRMCDLLNTKRFPGMLRQRVEEHNAVLKAYGVDPLDYEEILAATVAAGESLRPYVCNTVVYLHEAMKDGRRILFEGAQGTFLDLDLGTYPFVTSSNTTAGGACTGSGVPPHRMDRVVGVMKAYTTRVGEGPFPTETASLGEMLHAMGREFGATTGRARRCGWFDSVATRYATMINGIDELAVTNLDGLDSLETIRICIAYELDGKRVEVPPSDAELLQRCRPIYEEHPGWKRDIGGARKIEDLPQAARAYLARICELTGAELKLIGVGAERNQTIRL